MLPTGRRKAADAIFLAINGAIRHPTNRSMELGSMSQSVSAQKPRTVLSARRLVLMASAAVLGAGVLFSGAEFALKPQATFLASPAYAETAQRPVGFADIVEKVKP